MKNNKLQSKDVAEEPILKFLANRYPQWSFLAEAWVGEDVGVSFPPNTPYKIKLAKMRSLCDRGLVDGCTCGCRGDFFLTQKGIYYCNDKGLLNDCTNPHLSNVLLC